MGDGLAQARSKLNDKREPNVYRFSLYDDPSRQRLLDAVGLSLTGNRGGMDSDAAPVHSPQPTKLDRQDGERHGGRHTLRIQSLGSREMGVLQETERSDRIRALIIGPGERIGMILALQISVYLFAVPLLWQTGNEVVRVLLDWSGVPKNPKKAPSPTSPPTNTETATSISPGRPVHRTFGEILDRRRPIDEQLGYRHRGNRAKDGGPLQGTRRTTFSRVFLIGSLTSILWAVSSRSRSPNTTAR